MKGSEFVAAMGGAIIGGCVGYLVGMAAIEAKVRKEYEESSASFRRAMEITRINNLAEQQPVATEEELMEGMDLNEVTHMVAPVIGDVLITPREQQTQNDYHIAVSATETPLEMFIDGGVNDYGISYLEEEEYHEDDDRFKGQIVLVMDDNNNPSFFMGGVQITDWDKRVGDSILVDMLQRCPPGVEPVLYVRNHRTDEDYEVMREVP